MRSFTRLNPPIDQAANEDAFAEFAPEPAKPVDATEERDWFSEFPEEGAPQQASKSVPLQTSQPAKKQRPTNWLTLSESLKDEKS